MERGKNIPLLTQESQFRRFIKLNWVSHFISTPEMIQVNILFLFHCSDIFYVIFRKHTICSYACSQSPEGRGSWGISPHLLVLLECHSNWDVGSSEVLQEKGCLWICTGNNFLSELCHIVGNHINFSWSKYSLINSQPGNILYMITITNKCK